LAGKVAQRKGNVKCQQLPPFILGNRGYNEEVPRNECDSTQIDFSQVLEACPFPLEVIDQAGVWIVFNRVFAELNGAKVGTKSNTLALEAENQPRWWEQAQNSPIWSGKLKSKTSTGVTWNQVLTFKLAADSVPFFALMHPQTALTDLEREASAEKIQKDQGLVFMRSRQTQMGELLHLIAHQWRQPLTVINSLVGNVQLKLELGQLDEDYLMNKLQKITETVQSLSQTIENLRGLFSSNPCLKREDLDDVLRRTLELVGPSLGRQGVSLDYVPSPTPVEVDGFAGELVQVLLELFQAVGTAFTEGGTQDPRIIVRCFLSKDQAILRLTHNAPGQPNLASNFGLFMAKLIIEEHHRGQLSVTSLDQTGQFQIILPASGTDR
jgi:signal transduction histidine kinase